MVTSAGRGNTHHELTGVPLASWLPIKPGLVPHGLRHGHQTWMVEDQIPEVLRAERMGHTLPGIQHLYTHISEQMRSGLKQALQQRWEQALDQRAALNPTSAVAVLAALLKERQEKTNKIGSQMAPKSAANGEEPDSSGEESGSDLRKRGGPRWASGEPFRAGRGS